MPNLKSITDKTLGELNDVDKLWLKENQDKLSPEQKELYKFVLEPEEGSEEKDESKTGTSPINEGAKETPPGTGEGAGKEGEEKPSQE